MILSEFQLTKEQGILFCENKVWEAWDLTKRFEFQLFQSKLCMPFNIFHEAAEAALKRSVWTHEFGFQEELVKEYLGEKPPPTMNDIIDLIPKDKLILLNL